MKQGVRGVRQALTYIDAPVPERCSCQPLSSLHRVRAEDTIESDQFIPAAQELHSHLRTVLANFFPRSTPFSVLLLHISQLEQIHSVPQSATSYQRLRYHAPESFLAQVLVNAGRTIRIDDQVLVHAGTGAAFIFPEVDQHSIAAIAERMYQQIDLLEAGTVIPPLRRVTDILMGIGSYPKPGTSLEQMLYFAGLVARKLTLRPALSTQPRSIRSAQMRLERRHSAIKEEQQEYSSDTPPAVQIPTSIPFMHLPTQLPRRLKQLVPYQLALEIRCAPVGRDHDCLTIAMADPTDTNALNQLEQATGLSIFAVSCEIEALDALLANKW